MDPKDQIQTPEDSLEAVDLDAGSSVDDFIKQLEEKEKDLHITSDMTIEIEDSEFDDRDIPDDVVPEELMIAAKPAKKPVRPAASHVSPAAGVNKTRLYELKQELEALQTRMTVLREERNDIQEKSDRRLKDFESYRYRMDRERRGAFIDQISNLAAQMLPVFDNLDRGLNSVKGIVRERSPEFQQFYDGIVLVNQQMAEIFQDMGVESIATVGQPFDPNFHEAVAVEEDSDSDPNTITEELLPGYRIGNRVIRHSMVKVTTGPTGNKRAAVKDTEPSADIDKTTQVESAGVPLPSGETLVHEPLRTPANDLLDND